MRCTKSDWTAQEVVRKNIKTIARKKVKGKTKLLPGEKEKDMV